MNELLWTLQAKVRTLWFYAQNTIALLVGMGLIIFLVWFFFLSGPDEFEITNYPPTGSTIVLFGDSLVEGVGARQSGGLPGILSRDLNVQVINEGESGNTTRDAFMRLSDVTRHRPNIVVVLLGGNDILRSIPEEETFENLEAIVTTLQQSGAVTVILGVQSGVFFDEYEDNFEALAQQTGSLYVPNVLEEWFDQPTLKSDQIHPNDAGYQVMAEEISPTLRELLLAIQ